MREGLSARRERLALVALCLGSFLAVVDTTIVTIALPSMRREMGFSSADAQWVLNSYALVFGGLLLLLGRAGDLYGRRRLFVLGLALFAAASLAGGLATTPWVLVVARCVQGAGAAALVPASLSLLTATFAKEGERNRAIGLYGATAALGFVVGMVGGGVITELLGWRWVMFVNVPFALLALLIAPIAVPESREEGVPKSLDLAGAATASAGFASLIYAISEAEDGWASPAPLGFGTAGVLLLAGFALIERRSDTPLTPPAVLGKRTVVVPNAAIFLQSAVGVAWLYVLTLHFQEVLGHGPLVAGLLFLPMTLVSVLAAPAAGGLTTRFGVRSMAGLGLALLAAGMLVVAMRISVDGGILLVLIGTVIGEVGFMFSNVPLTIAASGGAGEEKRGLAAGLMNTSIQLGNAWGLGVVATVVAAGATAFGGDEPGPEAFVGGLRLGLLACVGFAALALLVVLAALRDSRDCAGGRSDANR